MHCRLIDIHAYANMLTYDKDSSLVHFTYLREREEKHSVLMPHRQKCVE